MVFQTDSKEIEEQFALNNYLIEYNKNVNKQYCIIYFSSNDIYYPNNKDAFYQQLVKKNRFEWYNTRISYGYKHIFLRDIKKQWYLEGINKDINSIEKIEAFLIEETKNFEIITVGSSAGGYAAVYFGQKLNARTTFCFNGQFMLLDILENSNENINPIVFREKNNPEINKYFCIKKFITKPRIIYYFYSSRSNWDIIQKNHISDLNLKIISFNSRRHGIPFLKTSLVKLLSSNVKMLDTLIDKDHEPVFFSLKIEGIVIGSFHLILLIFGFLTKKFRRTLSLISK